MRVLTFSDAGKKLADLHVNYESAKEFPLKRIENNEVKLDWRVEAMLAIPSPFVPFVSCKISAYSAVINAAPWNGLLTNTASPATRTATSPATPTAWTTSNTLRA